MTEVQTTRQGSSSASSDPLTVVVDDLSVTYTVNGGARRSGLARLRGGGSSQVSALRNISFTARQGQAVGVIGRNGSGKSTLLRVLAGLLPATSGRIRTDGVPVLLGISAALMPELPGERNIVLGALAMGLTREQVAEQYDGIIELSGLGAAIQRPMRTYSAGMAARLRFAIATAATPHVLLIDEALNTGDAEFRDRSQVRINELRDQAGTVFIVSHSVDTVVQTCNRVLWLDYGDLVHDGSPEVVTAAYQEFVEEVRQAQRAGRPNPTPPRSI